jgi:SNF2 family DNA or RNA helicase
MIKSPLGDNWMFFSKRYCDAKKMYRTMKNGKKKQLWINSGASNLDELHNKTKNIMLRRLKSEVLDMPEKLIIPQYHELSPTQWIEYDGLWEDYLVERKKKGKRGNLDKDLLELILLRKFVAMEMIPNTIELVDDLILEDKKVIIFTTFTEELNELKNHFGKKCVTHNGPMSTKDKQKSVDEFQNNPNIKVFIGNVISAGVGITLTAANVVVFNSYAWVPGINNQCEDRSHRLGQKSDVLVYYQLFENSVSVRIWETLKSKQSIIDQIMVGNEETITDKIIEMIYEQS